MPDTTLISHSANPGRDDQPSLISASANGDLTLSEYAALTGQSPHTVRTKIRRGEIAAKLVKGPRGMEYRITPGPSVSISATVIAGSDQGDQNDQPSLRSDCAQSDPSLIAVVAQLTQENAAMARTLSRLNDERAELYGRLGYFHAQLDAIRAQLQAAQARILELEAPKEAPAETTNHPTPEQNGQDSDSRTVSEESSEQSQAPAPSESTATTTTKTTNGQEASSGGAFKRLWRWLTQPV